MCSKPEWYTEHQIQFLVKCLLPDLKTPSQPQYLCDLSKQNGFKLLLLPSQIIIEHPGHTPGGVSSSEY